MLLWFGVFTPLVFFGSLMGWKKQKIENPQRYNRIPKALAPQPWYLNLSIVGLIGGVLPFG